MFWRASGCRPFGEAAARASRPNAWPPVLCRIVVLSVPITVIGANFDEETREQHRINQLRKRVLTLEKLRLQERLVGGAISDSSVVGMQEINCLLEVLHKYKSSTPLVHSHMRSSVFTDSLPSPIARTIERT